MPIEYGSPVYKGHATGDDAPAVQALRAAGAIIIGKTVTTELAFLTLARPLILIILNVLQGGLQVVL